jgi:hypothetical protein
MYAFSINFLQNKDNISCTKNIKGPLAIAPPCDTRAKARPSLPLSLAAVMATRCQRWSESSSAGGGGLARGGDDGRAQGNRAGGLGSELRWWPLAGFAVLVLGRATVVLYVGACGAAWCAIVRLRSNRIWAHASSPRSRRPGRWSWDSVVALLRSRRCQLCHIRPLPLGGITLEAR